MGLMGCLTSGVRNMFSTVHSDNQTRLITGQGNVPNEEIAPEGGIGGGIDELVECGDDTCRRSQWLQAGDLRAHERRVYSQNGEDGILEEILRRVGAESRYFVEFGVGSGSECNCARLALEEGWHGLFLEVDPPSFKQLEERYRNVSGIKCVRSSVTSSNIEQLLGITACRRHLTSYPSTSTATITGSGGLWSTGVRALS